MRRRRIDWDEEIRKTENIRRRGLFMSMLSFGMAAAFIFAMSRSTGADIEIPRTVLFAAVFCVSCVVLKVVMKHRSEKRKRSHDS